MFDDTLEAETDDNEVMVEFDVVVDKKEGTVDAGKFNSFCADVVTVLLTALEKVEGTVCSRLDDPPLTAELLLIPFERDEDEALSAGCGGKNFLIISRGSFSFGS